MKSKDVSSTEERITEAGLNGSSAKMLKPGTLLYSIFASIGAVGILRIPAATNQAIAGLSIKTDSINQDYLFHYLKSRESLAKSSGRGAAQSNINLTILRNMEAPVPSLAVQKTIVKQLEAVLTQLGDAKKQLSALDSLVKSRFVEMFGRADYPSEAIDDIAEVQGGLTKNKKRDKLALSLPYLRVANVLMDKIDLSEMKSIGLTEQELNATKLLKGDLLFVEGNGSDSQIGRSAIWTGEIDPCVHQNHLIRVRFGRNVLPVYAQSYFSSLEGRAQVISKAVSTSGLLTLSTGKIKALRLPVPPLELQEEFAIFASQFDKSRFVELRNAEMSDCFRVLSDAKRLNGTAT